MSRATKQSSSASPTAMVAGMAAGDDRALGGLYDAFGSVAYALALAITGTPDGAESVVSDAFGEAWRTASSYDPSRTSVSAWLTSIVRRTALRAVGRRPARSAVVGSSVFGENEQAPVVAALRSLTGVQREVIELSYYRGLTVGQIAAHLGEPESGTRELLRSAMQQLRLALSTSAIPEDHLVTRA